MKVQVCHGRTCTERFSEYINTRLENDKEKFKLDSVEIEKTLCMGYCKKGPNIKIDGNVHHYVTPVKAAELIQPNLAPKPKKKKNNYNNKK